MRQIKIITAILSKEIREIRRDTIIILLIIFMPITNLLIMGYSVNMDPKRVPTLVIDNDRSLFSRNLIHSMRTSGYFDIRVQYEEVQNKNPLVTGKAKIIVHIPDRFSKEILTQIATKIHVETDATDPTSTANALQVLQHLVSHSQERELQKFTTVSDPSFGTITLDVRKWYNPTGDSQVNLVPGLIGMILSIMPMLMASLSIVREREKGTLLHIHNSGITAVPYFIGKVIPYIGIGLCQWGIMLAISVGFMRIPMRGSYIELMGISLIFISLSITIGVILTSLIRNQLQAMQVLSFYFLLSNMLSGFLSPFEAMPQWSQLLGNMIPLTHFIGLIRGIMVKGNSVVQMPSDLIHLLAVFALMLGIAYLLIRKNWAMHR